MVTGIVKYFNPDGFGFLKRLDGGQDAALDIAVIRHLGEVKQGQRLTFDVRASGRGPRAFNVKRAERDDAPILAPDAPRNIYLSKRVKPADE